MYDGWSVQDAFTYVWNGNNIIHQSASEAPFEISNNLSEIAAHRAVYDAFGNETATHPSGIGNLNPFGFSNEYFDAETGLYAYKYRYYSTPLGRFLNRDPIAEQGGLNLYAFVGNRPVDRIDLLGNAPGFGEQTGVTSRQDYEMQQAYKRRQAKIKTPEELDKAKKNAEEKQRWLDAVSVEWRSVSWNGKKIKILNDGDVIEQCNRVDGRLIVKDKVTYKDISDIYYDRDITWIPVTFQLAAKYTSTKYGKRVSTVIMNGRTAGFNVATGTGASGVSRHIEWTNVIYPSKKKNLVKGTSIELSLRSGGNTRDELGEEIYNMINIEVEK